MKKTMIKLAAMAAVVAFAGFGLTSCGGGGGAEGEAADIPTDGLLGELAMLTAKYCNKLVDLRNKMFSGQITEEEMKQARAEFDETEKERDAKLLLAREAINGKEIPVEVQDGVPVKFDGNFKIDTDTQGTIFAIGTCTISKLEAGKDFSNIKPVPIDTDGKAIAEKSSFWYEADGKTSLGDWKEGAKAVMKASVKVGSKSARSNNTNEMKRWAKLAKFCVMDTSSDAYKQLIDQLNADKKAEELEAAKAIAGE